MSAPVSEKQHYSNEQSIPALDGVYGSGIMWCNVAEEVSGLSVIVVSHVAWSELICFRRSVLPQGPAACAMPNDPRHITTHDASLPREGRKDSLHRTNRKIFVECSSWETARLSTTDHLHFKSLLTQNITLLKGMQRHRHVPWSLFSLRLSQMCDIWYNIIKMKLHLQQHQEWDKSGMQCLVQVSYGENYELWNHRQTQMDPQDPDGIIYHVGTSSGHDSAFLLHCIHVMLNKDINNPFQFECYKILRTLSFVIWANGKVQCVCVCVWVLRV